LQLLQSDVVVHVENVGGWSLAAFLNVLLDFCG
jgi:hypothetical protein